MHCWCRIGFASNGRHCCSDDDSVTAWRPLTARAVLQVHLPTLGLRHRVLSLASSDTGYGCRRDAIGERVVRARRSLLDLRMCFGYRLAEDARYHTKDSGLGVQGEGRANRLAKRLEARGVAQHVTLVKRPTDISAESGQQIGCDLSRQVRRGESGTMSFARPLEIIGERREVHRQHFDLFLFGSAAGVRAAELRLEHVGDGEAHLILWQRAQEPLPTAVGGLQKLGAQTSRRRVLERDHRGDRMPETGYGPEAGE